MNEIKKEIAKLEAQLTGNLFADLNLIDQIDRLKAQLQVRLNQPAGVR